MWCLPAEAPRTQVASLNSRQTSREKWLGEPSHTCDVSSGLDYEKMSTRVTQSQWNCRALRHTYQIGPRLIWQKRHGLLFNEPTGVNTTRTAHELQRRSVCFAHYRKSRLFWHFCSDVQRKKLNHWINHHTHKKETNCLKPKTRF